MPVEFDTPRHVSIAKVRPNLNQLRQSFDKDSLWSLGQVLLSGQLHACKTQPEDKQGMAAIAAFRGEPPDDVRALYARRVGIRMSLREKANGDCVFYERERGCTIYPVRPRQCRTWPFWESNVATREDWQETCQICPGSGQGELISAEEVTRRVKVIRL